MKREIVTSILRKEQIRSELVYLVEYFSHEGEDTCKVLFGFAWGNNYYSGSEWPMEPVQLSKLIAKISEVEVSGIGKISEDDLYIEIGGHEFLFCHESDIHIQFHSRNSGIEHFFKRWQSMGFSPSERIKDESV